MAKALSAESRVGRITGIKRHRAESGLDLYPGLISSFIIAWRNSRQQWRLGSTDPETEVGRRTGARC